VSQATNAIRQGAVLRPAEDAAPPLIVMARLISVLLGGFLSFGLGLLIGIPPDRVALFGLTIAMATLMFTVVAVDRSLPRNRRNLLLSVFSLAYAVRFVLPALVFHVGGGGYPPDTEPNPIPLTADALTTGMFAGLVSYLLLLVGFALPIGVLASDSVPHMRREWSAESTLVVAFLLIVLGWPVLLASNFGLIPQRAGSGFLGSIAVGTTVGIGMIALCYQRYRSPAALMLLALLTPPTMFFNFFSSSKLLFLSPILLIVIVNVVVTRRLRAWWVVAGVVVMMLFYPIANAYREYMLNNELTAVQIMAKPQTAFRLMSRVASAAYSKDYLLDGLQATAIRLDGLGILSVIVRDAGTRVPFQDGWTLAYIPMTYIPRLLWPDKPEFLVGLWTTENFGAGPGIESSTGATWMGELYFNFGWLGILFGMPLLGIWFRFLQEYFLRIDATIPAMIAGVVIILALVHGLEGDLVTPTTGLLIRIAPIFFAHLAVRAITPPPARPPPPL